MSRPCPLFPRKQTFVEASGIYVFVPKVASCAAAKISSFTSRPAQHPALLTLILHLVPHASLGPFPGKLTGIT